MQEKKINILIVDDDRDDQEFLKLALSQEMPHARIFSFFNGSEVMDFLLKKNEHVDSTFDLPDVIFLDLNMSRIGGRETTYLLKKDEELKNIPVIILTTSSDPGEKKELLNLGAQDFFTKPSEMNELVTIVKKVKRSWLDNISVG